MNTQQKIETMRSIIETTNGKFFSVKFQKKDNSIREMTCRTGVTSKLKTDKPSTTAHIEKYLTVYDVGVNNYRNINLESLLSFKCGSATINFK